MDRARTGEGPSLVERNTYRWYFHAMRNAPPLETRPAEEIAAWKARDPIARFASDLLARGLLAETELGRIRNQVEAELQAAVAFAEASPFPQADDVLVDMYAR